MKKLFSVLAILLCSSVAFAEISGTCANCHTMHNSQNGGSMRFDDVAAPGAALLRTGACGGCHADSTLNNSTDNLLNTNGIPQINVETGTLAGGSFFWILQGADEKGHNVSDLGIGEDDNLQTDPPGFEATTSQGAGIGQDWTNNQLTCSGTYGCHGDHNYADKFDAISGAHHSNTQVNYSKLDEVASSYRFLLGIAGFEDDDWEATSGPNEHNVYAGTVRTTGQPSGNSSTISYLCAECHGQFHRMEDIARQDENGVSQASSPWLRHPTDIDMRDLDEASEYAAYSYRTDVPVAISYNFTTSGVIDDTKYNDEAIVSCISCHRAHGSPYDDLLRWDYNSETSEMIAGAGFNPFGCFACHTTKDDSQ